MKIPAFHIGQDQMFGAIATNWVGVVSNNFIFVPVKKKQKRNTRILPKLNADIPFTHNKQFKNTTCQVGIPQCVRNPHCNPTRKFCRKREPIQTELTSNGRLSEYAKLQKILQKIEHGTKALVIE